MTAKIYVGRLELAVPQEVRAHFHADPVQRGLVGVHTHQPGQEQSVHALDFDQRQHERAFRQELLRAEVADGEGVDFGRAVGDVNPLGLCAAEHVMAARIGVGVARLRITAGE